VLKYIGPFKMILLQDNLIFIAVFLIFNFMKRLLQKTLSPSPLGVPCKGKSVAHWGEVNKKAAG
jgi:hypothetical protein